MNYYRKRRIFYWCAIGFTVLAGVGMHFAFEFFNKAPFLAWLFPVNESVWEHLKLLFYPVVIVTALEYGLIKKSRVNIIPLRTWNLLIGMGFIIAAYYTYSGVIGRDFPVIDMILYLIAAVLVFVLKIPYLEKRKSSITSSDVLWGSVVILFFILFVIFSYHPPHINLFLDPATGRYSY
ncbi:MAG: hypothetical protein E7256_16940 [Lachnospiraceae bacterium]|nr:hypothetical protein [Lachnospiraceae bacterium]